MEDYRKLRKEGIGVKIDFEKDYDLVEWDFVDFVLEKKAFGVRWQK